MGAAGYDASSAQGDLQQAHAVTQHVPWAEILGPLAPVEAFTAELRRDRASAWERRLMALGTEVHRVKRESRKRAERGVEPRSEREKERAG